MEPWLKPWIRGGEFIMRMLARYRWSFSLLIVIVIIATAANAVDAYIVRALINTLSSTELSIAAKTSEAFWLMGILFVTMIATIILWRVSTWIGIRTQPNISREARLLLFEYSKSHSHRYWNDHFAGALANKISTAGRGVSDVFDMIAWNFVVQLTTFVYTLVFFFLIHPSLALVMVLFGVIFFAFFSIFGKRIQELSKARADARSVSHGNLVDSVTNIWNITSFTGGDREQARLDGQFHIEQVAHVRAWWYQDLVRSGQAILMWSASIGLMAYAVHLWSQNLLTIGDIAIIFTLSTAMMQQIRALSQQILQFFERGSDIQDALDTLVVPYDIVNVPDAKSLGAKTGAIEFESVDFRYREGLPLVFEGLALSIPAGQRVGLVGKSGAGKTTLVALIQRLYDLSGGTIRIDGQDISKTTLDSLRQSIAIVPQDPILFHRSLAENIGYGKPNATMEDIIEAAKRANAHEFIERMPEGYSAKVGERGVKLSGGQRQRIAIARAILKDAPILILDEATSALDSESEALIQDALRKLMEGRTTLVVAHRLSTLTALDRIVVFEDGRIKEDGTHTELLTLPDGAYRNLWERQAGGFIEA